VTVLWQISSLSVKDAGGGYVDEVIAGQTLRLGFALDTLPTGEDQPEVDVQTATAQLYRYLRPEERTPTSGTQVAVGDELEREEETGNDATFAIPGASLEAGEQYQLVVRAVDSTTRQFGATREVRVVAGP
jgi:hypothetical protein